ncbi:MAG: cytochrome c3 family protein [Humidesulfovibrio sp.]|uniref:acidic tetraheme cytochrome c3 TmcA n=1 Tax=Humidesulfovibrio sp. TaxID=2910988 RepID=UPI002735003C|nr:cytochrome c3 family protein [Humidesulfovibrio sp.]MDP2848830.1 cytochrome c3 family protein [Humidesulfovibrio sp.]
MNRTFPLLLAAALILAFAQGALSQQDMKTLAPAAYGKLTRPAAQFNHDQHNEKAKLEECVACHHGGKDGKQDKSASTEGTPCADCHKLKTGGKGTALTKAYHKQCIGCHQAKGKGPVACGQCHKR